jgi:hypothetical protein
LDGSHFHANYVSTSVFGDGDYYQATFTFAMAATELAEASQVVKINVSYAMG